MKIINDDSALNAMTAFAEKVAKERDELRNTNRALLAQLDEAREKCAIYQNVISDMSGEIERLHKRKDGWRRVALLYRKDRNGTLQEWRDNDDAVVTLDEWIRELSQLRREERANGEA